MIGQRVGHEVDQSSCIWRMNNAPTKGYTEDVGERTTIRVVSHTSVPLLLKNPDYFFKETNNTIYVIWGPFRNMREDGKGIVYNMLKKTVENYSSAKIYITTESQMNYCDKMFKQETGRDRTEGFRNVPYHYYEPGRYECDEYILHENAPYGGHRFITEKRVFAKWAKQHNITFTHPDWTLS
ncbi:alpha-N-acetylgalactosaminide alpha-2,6-sialyltransferase 3 isoform 2-T2 [Rhinophrynus dorsalis]